MKYVMKEVEFGFLENENLLLWNVEIVVGIRWVSNRGNSLGKGLCVNGLVWLKLGCVR